MTTEHIERRAPRASVDGRSATSDTSATGKGPRRPSVTERLAAASARRPRRVLALWAVVVLVALVLIGTSLKGLTTSAYVVGTTQSSTAEAYYDQAVGAEVGHQPTDVIVVSSTTSTVASGAFSGEVARLETAIRTDPGITGVSADLAAGSPLVARDDHAALVTLRAATDADIKPVVRAVESADGSGGFAVAVTGQHSVGNDFTTLSSSDLQHGELEFGLPIAIVVLLLVFGAVVAGLMPVLMAVLSIIVGLGLATLFAEEFHLSIFVVNMMTGMGLALGIDYSLFVISRFREERAEVSDKDAAIRRTGATASRAVLFSGSTFVVALLGLFLVRTNVLRSLAAGAVIVGAVSVAAALTLLPAMLSLIGDRVNSLRLPILGRNLGRPVPREATRWRAFIERILRRPALSLVVAGGVMLPRRAGARPAHRPERGLARCPTTLPSKQGYLAVQRYFPNQDPYPVEIVAVGGGPAARTDLERARDHRWPPTPTSAPGRSGVGRRQAPGADRADHAATPCPTATLPPSAICAAS